MDYERLWLQAQQIAALAKYIVKIDSGERDPEPRERLIGRLKMMIDHFRKEFKVVDSDEGTP